MNTRTHRTIGKKSHLALAAGLMLACAAPQSFAGGPNVTAPAARSATSPAATEPLLDQIIIQYKTPRVEEGRPGIMARDMPALASLPLRLNRLESQAQQRGLSISPLRRTLRGAEVLRLNRKLTEAQMSGLIADLIANDPDIEYAVPDRRLKIMAAPNDTLFPRQWALQEDFLGGVNGRKAWTKSLGQGVRVAVIDTGYLPHPDLRANLIGGYDFISDLENAGDGNARDSNATDPGDGSATGACDGSPSRSSWHGTHVAGIVAAVQNNALGIAGLAPAAQVVPVRALGRCGGSISDIADSIVWAAGGTVPAGGTPSTTNPHPVKVINMSLGGGGECVRPLQDAISFAVSRGISVVVAAGNEDQDARAVAPANCQGVITVAAVGRVGVLASYSNWGSIITLSAQGGEGQGGVGVVSTLNSGALGANPNGYNYVEYSGTSMAAPHVAATAAMMLSRKPTLRPSEVKDLLKRSARPFPYYCYQGCGAGILDADAALTLTLGGTITPPAPVQVNEAGPDEWEVENNGSLATAQVLPGAAAVKLSGSIFTRHDTDYYRLTVPARTQLTVKLAMGSMSNFDLVLYDAAGAQVGYSNNDLGVPEETFVNNLTEVARTFYARVRFVSGLRGGRAGAYTMDFLQD